MTYEAARAPVPLSFEEGEKVGGRVLYEESERVALKRKRGETWALLLLGSFPIGATPFIFWALSPVQLAGLLSIDVVALGLGVYGARHHAKEFSPIRVYEEGFSIGFGESPYFSLKTVVCVEEVKDHRRFSIPAAVVTFEDGGSLMLSGGNYAAAVTVYDYEGFHGALVQANKTLGPRRMPWDHEAAAFLPSFDFAKGPFVHAVEKIARAQGAPAITRDFLAAHWREAARAAGGWTYYSVRSAARRFFGR